MIYRLYFYKCLKPALEHSLLFTASCLTLGNLIFIVLGFLTVKKIRSDTLGRINVDCHAPRLLAFVDVDEQPCLFLGMLL
jgi:hypothetical protein